METKEVGGGGAVGGWGIYRCNCGCYVWFLIDLSLNGNHVLKCPNCGHEHCHVVKDGVITEDRWDSRNETYPVSIYTITTSTIATSGYNYSFTFSTRERE